MATSWNARPPRHSTFAAANRTAAKESRTMSGMVSVVTVSTRTQSDLLVGTHGLVGGRIREVAKAVLVDHSAWGEQWSAVYELTPGSRKGRQLLARFRSVSTGAGMHPQQVV